jgi:hypothetical protein
MPANLNTIAYRPGANADLIFARSKPTYVNAVVLSAGIESQAQVPQGAAVCIFSGDSDFYVRPDASAAIPASDVSDGSAPELNPAQWDVRDVQSLRLIAPDGAVVTLSFYQ